MKSFLFIVLTFISSLSLASEHTIDISNQITLSMGQTHSFQLPQRNYVHRLYIQAEGVNHDAYAQVIANGMVKGTLYVPGNDPHYVVTIADETSSIEVNVIQGNLIIYDIQASVNDIYSPDYMGRLTNSLVDLTGRSIELSRRLNQYLELGVYAGSFDKVIISAAEARAYIIARGELSEVAIKKLKNSIVQMEFINSNQNLLNSLLISDDSRPDTIEYLSVLERIKDLLDY